MEAKEETRSRAWSWTLNNWTMTEHFDIVEHLGHVCEYGVIGYEVGENGTPHLQGYMYYTNARSFSSVKKLNERIHFESSKGTPAQNKKYCTKDGLYVEFGTIPKQGRRSDFDELKEDIESGLTLDELRIKYFGLFVRYGRQIHTLYEQMQAHREIKPCIIWLYGDTGCGKTRFATSCTSMTYKNNILKKYYIAHNPAFMDGYEHQPIMIFDDVDAGFLQQYGKKDMLRILDYYEYRVNIKGSHAVFTSPLVFITSDKPPQTIMNELKWSLFDQGQLLRRIDGIVHLENGKQGPINQAMHILEQNGFTFEDDV